MKFQMALETAKALLAHNLSLLITGPPGIGKSALAETLARDLGWRLIVSHPVISDPVDFKGFPQIREGRAEFVPFSDLADLLTTQDNTLWLIDDLIQAPTAVQAALMQLVHPNCRQISGRKLSPKVRILACTNRRQDRAGGTGFIQPLKSRFVTFSLQPDHTEWIEWALRTGLSPFLAAYLRWKPDHLLIEATTPDLVGSPNPRTWEWASTVLRAGLPEEARRETLLGLLGSEVGAELNSFLEIAESLPDLSRIATSPDDVEVPQEPGTLFAAVGSLLGLSSTVPEDNLFRYLERFPEEHQVLFANFASTRQAPICNTSAFAGWTLRHQRALGLQA